ncbi:MAG: SH3 domain-containing protein, partial [Chloroflexota bacterium]|nr:SH3 domain-containing protein [Chloroflexota bacterium]
VATENPVVEELATEEATSELVAEAPAADDAAIADETADEAATDEVAVEEEAVVEALEVATAETTDEVVAEEPATDDAVVTDETADEATTDEVVTEEPATDERATEEGLATAVATTDVVAAEEEIEVDVATEEVVAEEAVTEEAAAEEGTAEEPAAATEEVAVAEAGTDTEEVTAESNQQDAGEQPAQSEVDPSRVIGTAEVVSTNGDGVRCRTSASSDASTITVLAEGTTVQILSVERNGYLGVICGGQAGFANVEFLYSGGAGDEIAANAGSVTVVGTGGGLNCRSGPGLSYGVLTILRDGTTLSIRGASSNGWAPVVCGGQNGYVSIDYVEVAGSASSGGGTGDNVSAVAATMVVQGTNGDGVRCRTGASTSSSVITVLAEGTRVTTRGGAMGGWVPVVCGGTNGYVSATYLGVSSSAPAPSPSPTPPPVSSGMVSGDHAKVTDRLNLRYSASMGAGISTTIPAGTVVLVTGGVTNGFHPIDWDGLKGFVSKDYIVETTASLSERGGSGATSPPTSGDTGSTATGSAMVNFALRYEGYPYIWASHGPSGFDCSGFTYWVTKNVTGKDIGYGLWTQVSAGTPVGRSSLQPGDLIFFQNTYKAGLSHSGIYIGNNRFIHAENETTGVRISDLNSTYYGSRWYGAVRMT